VEAGQLSILAEVPRKDAVSVLLGQAAKAAVGLVSQLPLVPPAPPLVIVAEVPPAPPVLLPELGQLQQ